MSAPDEGTLCPACGFTPCRCDELNRLAAQLDAAQVTDMTRSSARSTGPKERTGSLRSSPGMSPQLIP
jgi:hypothetical protein